MEVTVNNNKKYNLYTSVSVATRSHPVKLAPMRPQAGSNNPIVVNIFRVIVVLRIWLLRRASAVTLNAIEKSHIAK